tara:strand:- start:602 stop:1375 length:774 start_codon:yes stop_codon:yes gene_type:complete
LPDDDNTQSAHFWHFPANGTGRDFVVGDIHGHLERLYALLSHVHFAPARDRLFSVGDLIDRGPDSAECLGLVDEPWFHAARGNHEQMLCDAHRYGGQARALWLMNGGAWSRKLNEAALAGLAERAATLPLVIEVDRVGGERVGLVHADVAGADWPNFIARLGEAEAQHAALWSRDTLGRVESVEPHIRERHAAVEAIATIYHGHTPLATPRATANRRWLDTGVFLADGCLTLTELGSHEPLWSIDAEHVIFDNAWAG